MLQKGEKLIFSLLVVIKYENREKFMKKIVILLMCLLMILQNTSHVYATEVSETIIKQEDISVENTEFTEKMTTLTETEESIEVMSIPVENTQFIKETRITTEVIDEQVTKDVIEEEKDETFREKIFQEEINIEFDDPQYGRANGYLDSAFIGIQSFSTEND